MLTAFDIAVGILVLISALLATARGLTREVLSLLTWAGSAAIAVYAWQFHPEIARTYVADETVADIATIAITFIVALVILHLITMRLADFITDSKLGPLDRTLGFVFGAARGILIAVVVVIFATWLLRDNLPPWFAESRSLPTLQSFGEGLVSILPENLEDQVNDILNRGGPVEQGVPTDDAPNTDGVTDGEGAQTPPAEPADAQADEALTPA